MAFTTRQVHWNKVRKALGFNITWHGLRATAATLMVAGGTSPKIVQQTLGHSNVQTTFNLYVEPTPQGMQDAARVMDDLVSGQQSGQRG